MFIEIANHAPFDKFIRFGVIKTPCNITWKYKLIGYLKTSRFYASNPFHYIASFDTLDELMIWAELHCIKISKTTNAI